ncbi:MAG: GGDEF domain-containing protein [Rubrivivax sp.]|nr:GGDEF domain-containing protein [Rubrivivax sp.]
MCVDPGPLDVAGGAGRRATDSDTVADDWDQLFVVVTARLAQILGEPPATGMVMHDAVADCMLALTQLQALRARQRGVDRRLEGKLRRSSGALAAAQVELRQARHDAQHDSLTSLPNRGSFDVHLSQALHRNDRPNPALAVLFLDLDGFKPVNDRHGHHTGDALLRTVASRLRRAMRKHDMVCRLGGDEFACILSAPGGRAQLSQIATQLFDAVSAPLEVAGLTLKMRPSMGIAQCPSDGDTVATLLKHADAAMYRAKRSQLGFAFFDRGVDL